MGTDPMMNLHTHTVYSDGTHPPGSIVLRACQGGLEHIAITDHFETTKVPRPLTRDNFPRYMKDIKALKRKYEGRIEVLSGVEIDTNPGRCDHGRLPYDLLNELDVVLFEYASDPMNGGMTLDALKDVRSKLNMPCGLCHWDIDRIFPNEDPAVIADMLSEMDLFVEVSTSDYYTRDGLHFYELGERFFKAFDGKVKLSIGTDTHHRLDEVVNIQKGQEFVRKHGLGRQMLFQ
ncbi:MAG: PHP domain-containing protein [Euryarchaeota archaeon]|nr:PHP domain-containing protein [Euryarchaeota archaeon]